MSDEIVVAALGGNSLLDPKLASDVASQFKRTAEAMRPIAKRIAAGDHIVITHGNGPQVGYMLLRSELAAGRLHNVPLDSLVADSQGAIGYMIQRTLRAELESHGEKREVVCVVTEVEVDPESAEAPPSKPVGRFYTKEEAEAVHRERGWTMVDDAGRGWRRVVVSPIPKSIVQLDTIKRLVEQGVTVVACGGGGIPVYHDSTGILHGIEGVVDKDRTSSLLASALGARRMVITTGVDAVYENFLSPERVRLDSIDTDRLRELYAAGSFPPGSMGPKVEAALSFLEAGGEEVVICLPEDYARACEGRVGTRISKAKK